MTVQTPAKINLSLAVGPPRHDGYHPLVTVYQAVSLFDHVIATPAAPGEVTLEVDPSSPLPADVLAAVPTDDGNLAVRAARLLAERTGTTGGARLRLHKAIPVAAGLAGGSSDAAAALVACNRLWGTRLSRAELQVIAAELGSDVPFCLVGGTAIGHGRGERVSPLLARGPFHWVLAIDKQGLSTPMVYAELDRLREEPGREQPGREGVLPTTELDVPDALVNALRSGDVPALGRAMFNDLQPAALSLRPDLCEVLELRPAVHAHGALVSGSGPTCLFLAHGEHDADTISVGLVGGGLHAVHRVVGPVPGARVVEG